MKNALNIGTIKIPLTVALLSICAMTLNSQEPDNKRKAKKEQLPVRAFSDTTIVNEHKADTLYLKQSVHMNALDSLIQEKQKK